MTSRLDIDLTGVHAKLAQGRSYLNAFHAEATAWMERKPYDFWFDHDADRTEHFIRLIVREGTPTKLRLLVGDCVHNYRSALDHFVYAAAVARNGGKPLSDPDARACQFPVCTDPTNWPKQVWHLNRVSATLRDAIEERQPYQGRHNKAVTPDRAGLHPLALLSTLDNADKHRLLTEVVTQPMASIAGPVTVERGSVLSAETHLHDAMEDGAKLFEVTLSEPNDKIQVALQLTAVISIRHPPVDGEEFQGAIALLEAIEREVRATVLTLLPSV